MGKELRGCETPATMWLRQHGVDFSEHRYQYVEHGGTAESARALAVAEHSVVKTLVMADEDDRPLLVLMHGDRKASTKDLARQTGRKAMAPCAPDEAQRHIGYRVGGTSPFGVRKAMPVYFERTVLSLPRIYINGGRRGFLVGIDTAVLRSVLQAQPVDCASGE